MTFFLRALFALMLLITPAMAHDISAVTEPNGICTEDINQCGQASACQCAPGYSYSSDVGLCLIDNVFHASNPGVPVEPNMCAVTPTGVCTLDINPAGHASACSCENGQVYSAVTGLCMGVPIKG